MGATFNTTMIMKKNNLTLLSRKSIPTLATVTAAVLLAMSPRPARAAAFAPGSIVVERLGDGTQTLTNKGNTMFMDEFTTSGTAVQSVRIDDSGSNALIDDGTANTAGGMTLSPDGRLLCLPGYNTAQPYTASLSGTTSASVPRGVGTMNASGIYQLAATTTSWFSKQSIRGATTDGNGNFWACGSASSGVGGGIYYLGASSAPALLTDGTFRLVHLFGTNLWFDVQNSSGPGGYNLGVYEFTGAPTGSATPATILSLPGSSTYGLSVNNPNNPTVIYCADDSTTIGIAKYTSDGSGTWFKAYTLYPNNVFGLAVDWTTTPATIYATTKSANNSLIKIVDNGAGSTVTTLATAGSNKIFRNVAFAPISVIAGNNNSGNNLNLTCTTVPGGAYSWTGPNGFSSSQQNPTIANATTAAAGTYTAAVTWGGIYNATATTTATVFPGSTISAASSVCPGSTGNTASVPDAGAGATYAWTISGGAITVGPTTKSITYSANVSGTIILGCAITNSLGNGVKGSATVSILATPITSASNNGPYCSGSTIQLAATGSAGDTYSWTGPNGFTSILQNPAIANATPVSSGVYTVTRTTACGISPGSSTSVTVNGIPSSTITVPTSACGNSSGNLASVPDAGAGAGYHWTITGGTITAGGSTNAIAYTANASGTVALGCTVTNSSGCYSNASSATVAINPQPSSAIATPSLVLAWSANTASVANAGAGASYVWTISGGTITAGSTTDSITYTVGARGTAVTLDCTVTANTGCASTGSARIAVYAPFTTRNLAVLRIGDGAESLSASGNSVFIDEYASNGTLVQTIPLPDSGPNAILEVPTSSVEGSLTLSSDGKLLALPGYRIAYTNSTSSVATTPASAVPRAACTLDGGANFKIGAVTTDAYSAYNLRCIATDGTSNFWAAGSADGTWWLSPDSESQIQINQAANTRQVNIFNGNLYIVTASSLSQWGAGLYGFSGLPTSLTAPSPLMLCANASAPGVNPTGFSISPDGLTAYVADQIVGINKWTNSDGTWYPAYSFDAATSQADGLVVDWSGANPVLYGTSSTGGSRTSANALFMLVDTGMASEPVTIAVAPAKTLFRGVAFTPKSSPVMTLQPLTQSNAYGSTITFASASDGAAPLTIQWQASGDGVTFTNLTGAVSPNYSFTAASSNNGELFRVIYTNACGAVTSSAAMFWTGSGGVSGTAGAIALTGGVARLTFARSPDSINLLETSTNLFGPWQTIATNVAFPNGLLNFTDHNATNRQQFYRTRPN